MSLVSVLGCGTWFFPIEERLYYIKQLRDIAAKAGDQVWLAAALANIGYVYRLLDRNNEAIEYLREAVQCYETLNDSKGGIFPLTNLVQLFGDLGNMDMLAEAMQKLGRCYEVTGEKLQAAETYARAASFWLVPFGKEGVSSVEEAQDRAGRANRLLTTAHPILVEANSSLLERAEYDLAFCQKVLDRSPRNAAQQGDAPDGPSHRR
jgi:tetratricopeptide (TPR) repeat protein